MATKGTYYKALLLLIVFSMNTIVSFACSFSSLFHRFHHHQSSTSSTHKHTGGHHNNKDSRKHYQNKASHHQHESAPAEKGKDDCCSKNFIEVEKLEKSVSRTIEAPAVIFLTSFIAAFSPLFSLQPAEENTLFPHHVRWRIPATIQDLRIVIQSFQI